ncbi:hypothetical protein [Sneathiella sp.]|uniref:hypothetical protein n=1 Tax=Sneathiella sp. TaxID=1964365 RepID=UPI0025E9D892|nr:hypothetical protein [Sneathiella sp.]
MKGTEKLSSDQPGFQKILEEHPLYSSLKEQSSSELVEQLTTAMEAFWRPDSEAQKNWIKAWASYQQDMLKLWTAQFPGIEAVGFWPGQ